MELSSSHIKKMKNDEKEEHSRRLSTELFGPGTITLGSKQKSELITGAKRLMTDDFGSVPLKRSASTTMEAMPLMTRREIARVASAFANEIDVLPTTEQRRLYNVLSDSSHRPTELQDKLESWIKVDPSYSQHNSKKNMRTKNTISTPPRTLEEISTALLSGLVNGLLATGFNCVKATLIFGQSHLTTMWIPVGVCMYHFATIVAGPSTTTFSDCRIAIGGPNIKHPLLFGPTIASAIVTSITGIESSSHRRSLAVSGDTYDYDEETLLSSIIFAMAFSTFLTTICWFTLGHFRLTRAVQFLPEFVVSGFIASVGYMIMLKAIFVSTGYHISLEISKFDLNGFKEPKFYYLLAPAIGVGVPMFFMKQYHIGKPLHVLPAFMIVPLVIFYVILAASGTSTYDARESGWFLEEFDNTPFYKPWESLKLSKVDYSLVFERVPDMLVLTLVLTINALLNLVAIRNEFDVELDYNKEMKLCGMYNVVNTAGLTAPGYILLKFTAVNHGIIHNIHDRLPGIVYTAFVGVVYASGYPLINLFPRFFLGALVFFAGFGFIWTNAVMTYGKMPRLEYASIFAIILITALTQLMYAVVCGILIALFIFVWKYARRGAVRNTAYGTNHRSQVVRSYRDEQHLNHLGQLFVVLELHRFLFFGSVIAVQERVKEMLDDRESRDTWRQVRYLILDFSNVDGIDITATMVFTQIAKSCRNASGNIELLVSGMNEKTRVKFALRKDWTSISRDFPDLDTATEWVENRLLSHAARIRRRWLAIEPLRKLHARSVLRAKYEAYEELLGGHLGESLWQYIVTEQVERGDRLCVQGEKNDRLYLLQSGRLTSYLSRPDGTRMRLMTWLRGAYVNEDSLFLDMPVPYTIVADERSTVLVLTRRMWCQLEADDPMVALQIQRTVMLHTASVRDTYARRLKRLGGKYVRDDHYEEEMMEKKNESIMKKKTKEMSSHAKFANSVKRAVDESNHDFHHIPHDGRRGSLSRRSEDEEGDVKKVPKVSIHLSRRMRKLAISCFEKHLKESSKQDEQLMFGEVQDALMDLGKFPTLNELKVILQNIARSREISWPDFKRLLGKGVPLSLFLKIVSALDLAKINTQDLRDYFGVFRQYASKETGGCLTTQSLGHLMQEMDHPETPLKLQKLMREWGHGEKVDFSNFVSMMAHFVKDEELDERVEDVFKAFCHHWKSNPTFDSNDLRTYMQNEFDVSITMEEANEMIWEADLNDDGRLDYHSFRNSVTMVSDIDLNRGFMMRTKERSSSKKKKRSSSTSPRRRYLKSVDDVRVTISK